MSKLLEMGYSLAILSVVEFFLVGTISAERNAIRGPVVSASYCLRRSKVVIVERPNWRMEGRVAWIRFLLVLDFVKRSFLVGSIGAKRFVMREIALLVWYWSIRNASVGPQIGQWSVTRFPGTQKFLFVISPVVRKRIVGGTGAMSVAVLSLDLVGSS